MEILKLSESQLSNVSHLDPFGVSGCLSLPGAFALTAVNTVEGEEGTDHPAGLLVGRIVRDTLRVEWLLVEIESRLQGIGLSLLEAAFQSAKAAGAKEVEARFFEEADRSAVCAGGKDFLTANGFSPEKECGGMASLCLKEIAECDYFKGYRPAVNMVSFGSFPVRERVEILKELSSRPSFAALCPLTEEWRIDPDISICLPAAKGMAAALLVGACGEKLCVLGACCEDSTLAEALFFTALDKAIRKFGGEKEVYIEIDRSDWEWALDLLPSSKVFDGSILCADVSEYEED